ncbi:MAG TPA: hypothetical protein PLB81_10355, partial [Deltaproteobacteria bacterium]|nr:hypothetical protein [Deltaproteobacteria bacterium]
MHLHLAGARTRSHAEVLDAAAEAEHDMALEMADGHDGVGLGDGAGDLDLLEYPAWMSPSSSPTANTATRSG